MLCEDKNLSLNLSVKVRDEVHNVFVKTFTVKKLAVGSVEV